MAKVLIVENDLMIADFLEETLLDAGYTVIGIASTIAQAVSLAHQQRPDLAILDLRLNNDEKGTDVVPLVPKSDRVGILYATGDDGFDLTRINGHVCIRKPYLAAELLSALRTVQQIISGGIVKPPAPDNARVLV